MIYKSKRIAFAFIFPAVFFVLVFLYIPFFLNIFNSFFEIKGLAAKPGEFLGLSNYITLFKDPLIKTALYNSLLMMVLTIVFQVGIALVLAILVDAIKKGANFFRTVFFFPIIISATAIGLMFNLFYAFNGGMLNQILGAFGLDPVLWLSKETALTMIIIPVIWQYIGFYFVILLTGLNNIPTDVYESAAIDGATGFKRVFYITLPLLSNVIKVCVILSITGSLKVFDLPWIIAPNGAPNGITHFTGTYMYYATFREGNVDYGSTIALMIVVLGIVFSQIVNKFLKQKEY